MAIFDISKKNRPKKIYTFEEVYGGNIISNLSFSLIKAFFIFLPLILISHLVTGNGDVTYNQRRGIPGAISVRDAIAYHLFIIEDNHNTKLLRKTKWHLESTIEEVNNGFSCRFLTYF